LIQDLSTLMQCTDPPAFEHQLIQAPAVISQQTTFRPPTALTQVISLSFIPFINLQQLDLA